ncbi:MAG: HYR domain-containing protein [Crocinitomicaceae bacterium]|nr:HYR domain-containing protein [Crocinitomicaceae bacterium]
MIKSLTFAIGLLLSGSLIGQTSFFSDDFESGIGSWIQTGDATPNSWIVNSCAGNGTSLPGTTSMYITSGGTVPGCGATGTEQHAYVDAPVGINEAISATNVDAGCLASLTASFDYRIDGMLTEDIAELVYSTNGGVSWTAVGTAFAISNAWTSASIALPALLNATSFDIGFRFTYNDNTINGAPIAIDNFDISGDDLTNPTITCPANQSEYLDGTCSLLVPDYTGSVVTGDNCISYGAVVVTQAPPASSTIGNDALITLTGTDAFGNTASCNFTLQTIDTLDPTITCPANFTVTTTTGCTNLLSDHSGLTTANDNCTFLGSLIFTQFPPVGTSIPAGPNTITIMVEDASGNTNSCVFDLEVEDQEDPVISVCSPNQNVIVNGTCAGVLSDYTGFIAVSDNCTTIGNLLITQSPAVSTIITSNTLVTITVEDEKNNTTTCSFTAILSDTISPTPTCPADFTIAINGNCEYLVPDLTASVLGTDNCSILANMGITQNPVASSTQSGITNVLITLTDEQGNIETCITTISPDDIIAPTITCPGPITENIGNNCDFSLPNYSGVSLVVDNCPNYSFTQSPAPGTTTSVGTQMITMTVTDAGGNTATCSFSLDVIENELPTITCPPNISTCDPLVSFPGTLFSDNCVVAMAQTDLTGLTSGSTFPVGITTLEFTATDESGNIAMCSFDIEILDFPSSANIVDDTISLCDQNSAVLNADSLTSGTGLWEVSSGVGAFNNQFTYTTGVNNIAYGTNVYTWTVSSASCGSLVDSVIVINSQQDLQASTQDLFYSCMDADVALMSNVPLYGIGTWTTDGNGIIDDINSANTSSTLVDNGWQNFIWTITSGACPSSADTLQVFSMQSPIIGQSDTAVCLENDLLLFTATSPSIYQTSAWSVIGGTVSLDTPDNFMTDAEYFGLGTNTIIYTLMNPTCGEISDTIQVVGSLCDGFDPIIPTVITPGNIDGKNDVFTIDFLSTMHPNCSVVIFNRWGSVVFKSKGYDKPWDGTFKGEYLPMGTYFYKIDLNDTDQTVLTGDISIIN